MPRKRAAPTTGPAPTTRTLGRDDWTTPPEVYDPIDAVMGFDLDAAAGSAEEARADAFIGPADDGLAVRWRDFCPRRTRTTIPTVWLNPPYGRAVGDWLAKAAGEAATGIVVCVLIPANTDTEYWHQHVVLAPTALGVIFLGPRVRFVLPEEPDARSGAPKGHALIVYGPPMLRAAGPLRHAYWRWDTEAFAPALRDLGLRPRVP
jgi:site-specific DNA-methyltransferase (adenine-specific)